MRKKLELTQEDLYLTVKYDPYTGIFTWKERPIHQFKNAHGMNIFNSQKAGLTINSMNNDGYIQIRIYKNNYYGHRLAWFYTYGVWPKKHLDHINGIKHDNRICNLRECNDSENMQNLKKANKNNKSTGLIGSYFNKYANVFYSRIQIKGVDYSLGNFNNAMDAHNAYLTAKRQLHPFGTL
jgi:hypothetical protein